MKYATMFSFVLAVGLFDAFAPLPLPSTEPLAGVAELPRPERGGAYLVFAGKLGGEITKKQVEGQREVGVEGCARGSRIFSFTLEVTRAGQKASFISRSHVLTDDMLTQLRALRPGDTFTFKNTQAYLPDGKDVVQVHSRTFIVV